MAVSEQTNREMMFSQRSGVSRELNSMARALETLARDGRPLLDLTISNPTRAGIPYDAEGIAAALSHPRVLSYEPAAFGARAAREAVCASWAELGFNVGPERVLITASTSEAYAYVFKLLCDPGDEVLIPAPSYPLFDHLAGLEAVHAVPYPLAFDGAWHIDFPRLEARVSPRTRAIVVVHPNNPTGHFVRTAELETLARLGLPLIADEVFARYSLDVPRGAARSCLATDSMLVFILSGLSKLAGLPQMKAAWLTAGGPAPLVNEALARLELIADTYLSPSAPVMLAVPELLALCAPTAAHIHDRVAHNARHIRRALADSPISTLPIEGGWYAVLRLPNVLSEEEWTLSLLDEAGVVVQPGYFFDFAEEPYAVVSLLTPTPELSDGIARLRSHVEMRSL